MRLGLNYTGFCLALPRNITKSLSRGSRSSSRDLSNTRQEFQLPCSDAW